MDDPRAVSQILRSDPPGSERRPLHGCASTRRKGLRARFLCAHAHWFNPSRAAGRSSKMNTERCPPAERKSLYAGQRDQARPASCDLDFGRFTRASRQRSPGEFEGHVGMSADVEHPRVHPLTGRRHVADHEPIAVAKVEHRDRAWFAAATTSRRQQQDGHPTGQRNPSAAESVDGPLSRRQQVLDPPDTNRRATCRAGQPCPET